MQEKITVERIKDLIYDLQNEFDNEMDENFTYGVRKLDGSDFELMCYYLDCFVKKLELAIEDKLCDEEK